MIAKCTCRHAFQDVEYGKGMRVMTPKAKDGYFVCTVCGKEHHLGGTDKKAEKKAA
jgi:hypothetical protein